MSLGLSIRSNQESDIGIHTFSRPTLLFKYDRFWLQQNKMATVVTQSFTTVDQKPMGDVMMGLPLVQTVKYWSRPS